MEGLPYDFGIEDDDDEEDISKKSKNRSKSLLESLTKEEPTTPESKSETKAETEESKEISLEVDREEIDKAPELDAEAPLEHLSRVETEAIAQTMASERLSAIRELEEPELTSEALAAESFLENVEASGDIDQAYNETLLELGETAVESSEVPKIETETALPVDPESLLDDARNELTPNVYYHIQNETKINKTPEPVPSNNKEEGRPEVIKKEAKGAEKVHSNIVDYVVGRRYGRLVSQKRHEDIERRLSQEVSQLRLQLSARETHVRELAQNRTIENKTENLKPPRAESVDKVLIKSEVSKVKPDTKKELAGISAHTMKQGELLQTAQAIKFEDTNLRQIYETHLVGEKGLRRVVAEYLRGGNFKKALRTEMLEREKDFERDPKLRDQASSQSVATSHSGLDDLLHKSGIDWSETQPTLTQPKVKGHNLPGLIEDIKSPSNPLRRVADVIMIGSILAMAAVIAILLIVK